MRVQGMSGEGGMIVFTRRALMFTMQSRAVKLGKAPSPLLQPSRRITFVTDWQSTSMSSKHVI